MSDLPALDSSAATANRLQPKQRSDFFAPYYHPALRCLHWTMALGLVLAWITGVLTVSVEGVPSFVEGDRQGAIRDLHKSIGLSLLLLLVIRIAVRLSYPVPPLPAPAVAASGRLAHLGHFMIYMVIAGAGVTGFAIADLQGYGNHFFGTPLPQGLPVTAEVFGWSVDPWSYVAHAVLVYALLAAVLGHVLLVAVHRRWHRVSLLPRILLSSGLRPDGVLTVLLLVTLTLAAGTAVLAARAHLTLGALEQPRDYRGSTPFSEGETP